MKLCDGFSIVFDEDTTALLLISGVDVLAEFDERSKTWVSSHWLMKPDFMWRPASEKEVVAITDGNLPSPEDFRD